MAIAASLLAWGLGHLLAGRTRRGVWWFVAWVVTGAAIVVALVVPTLVPALVVLIPLHLVLHLWALVDAFRCARHSPRPMLGRPALRYLAAIGLLVVVFFLNPVTWFAEYVRGQWVEAFVLPAKSMSPTIQPGDRILVHKRPWAIGRWDIVAFHSIEQPGERYVSRIAGLPGEKVEIVDTTLYINDAAVPPPKGAGPYEGRLRYFREGNGVEGRPIVLGPDEYFVLGDNSPMAADSRYWRQTAPGHQPGALPRDLIIGRVTVTYWPVGRWRQFR